MQLRYADEMNDATDGLVDFIGCESRTPIHHYFRKSLGGMEYPFMFYIVLFQLLSVVLIRLGVGLKSTFVVVCVGVI